MTLRRFLVLVRGLGPHSATGISLAAARGYLGGAGPVRRQPVRETSSVQESENVLAAMFGFRPAKVPS